MPAGAKRRHKATVRATPENGPGSFEALVATYNIPYDIGWGWTEMVLPGCFTDSIDDQPAIPIFYSHDWPGGPIGVGDDIEESADSLTVRGHLYLGMAERIDVVYQAMKDEALREWSIGFWPEAIINDKDQPLCDQIAKGDLAESSVCVRGANPETGTVGLASRAVGWIDGDEAEARKEVARLRKVFAVPDLSRRRVAPPRRRDADEATPVADLVEQIDALVDELLEVLGLPDSDDGDEGDDSGDGETSRARMTKLMGSAWGRELLAQARSSQQGASGT